MGTRTFQLEYPLPREVGDAGMPDCAVWYTLLRLVPESEDCIPLLGATKHACTRTRRKDTWSPRHPK